MIYPKQMSSISYANDNKIISKYTLRVNEGFEINTDVNKNVFNISFPKGVKVSNTD